MFEDLPLDEFGNRIPPITAEIAWAGAPQAVVKDTTFLPGAAWFTGSAVLDPERGVLYFKTSAGAAQRYIRLAQTHRTARTWQLNAGAAATSALEQVRCLALEPGNAPRPLFLAHQMPSRVSVAWAIQ